MSSLLRGVARLWNEVAATPSVALKRVDDVAGTTMTGLGIVRLPSVTREAMTDIARLHDSDLD
ncbi:MAG: hypothetical protein KGQ49_05535, partial [Verrucomicrobia bacterium]|nr:hypothetical protein [Verrucomicrobiota bacterium]